MTPEINDALALAQANFLLTRNLLKWLYVTGKFHEGELSNLLDGTIGAAEAGDMRSAAELLRGLRVDLNAYDL